MNRRQEIPPALRERFTTRIRLLWAGRGGSIETSESIVTETLERVVEAMVSRQIENLDAVPSFVYRTARQVCDESAAISQDRNHGDGDPLALFAEPYQTTRVSTALTRLAEADRSLIDAYYVKCLPAHVIALNLGLSPNAVRRRKDQALQRLRDETGRKPKTVDRVPQLIDS